MAKSTKKSVAKSRPKTPKRTSLDAAKGKRVSAPKKRWYARTWGWFRARRIWQKIILILIAVVMLFTAQAFLVAVWYQQKHKNEKLTYGVTFISGYARYFDLDPHETMLSLRDDLGFKRFRLVSYWDEIEKTQGTYDFSDLDWQFDRVDEVGGQVSLAIGLRQPRWPECHAPGWVDPSKNDVWNPQLQKFMKAVIERYKDRPSLKSYQLENEYFLGVFGECKAFGSDRQRLIDEYNLVKATDSKTPVIVSLSNNYLGVPVGQPRPDVFGVSVYKRVFDQTITKRYFEYPFASWHYASRAGWSELLTGRPSMLHELQAEPWPPTDIKSASIEEQDKSMNAKRLKERIDYGKATGFKDIDLWGGEWWYWRKVKMNDPSLWEAVRNNIPPENF